MESAVGLDGPPDVVLERAASIPFWRARSRARSSGVILPTDSRRQSNSRAAMSMKRSRISPGAQDDHVLAGRDANEAVDLEPLERLHDGDAADPDARGDGGGDDALSGRKAPLDDGAAEVLVGGFLEGLVPGQSGEEFAADRRGRPLLQ